MDPNETVKTIMGLTNKMVGHSFAGDAPNDGCELAEAVDNLDVWLAKGGFLPKRWEKVVNGGLLHRAQLAEELANKEFDFFNDYAEMTILHLMRSIILGQVFDMGENEDGVNLDRDLLRQLQGFYDVDHAIWKFIRWTEGPDLFGLGKDGL